jgi:hypothetical protein
VRDAPPEAQTWEASGRRCDSAAHGWEDHAQGVQLASALRRSVTAVERLWCVRAITTLELVAQGTAVVTQDTRRWGDAHGCRGQRDLTIG